MQSNSPSVILGVLITKFRSGPRAQAKGSRLRVSSSVSPTHSPEQSGAGLSAGAHADLLKLPAVRHCGDHLGQLLLLALQHSINMLGGHLLGNGRTGGRKVQSALKTEIVKQCCKNNQKHKID